MWTQVATIAWNPVRIPMGEFMKLSYIPLPLMTEDGQKYKICMGKNLTRVVVGT